MAIDLPSELIDRLRAAQRIVAFTGAGISAESGLSTFRDKQTGLWAKYRPEDLATPQAFQRNPRMVWEWYEWRRGVAAKAEPNPGHYALAQIEAARSGFFLATQNVDGLHARAGSAAPAFSRSTKAASLLSGVKSGLISTTVAPLEPAMKGSSAAG